MSTDFFAAGAAVYAGAALAVAALLWNEARFDTAEPLVHRVAMVVVAAVLWPCVLIAAAADLGRASRPFGSTRRAALAWVENVALLPFFVLLLPFGARTFPAFR